ncbi:MAG: hypothetical protein ACFFDM_13425 [Candidatus Thorarchaeota archaeon]
MARRKAILVVWAFQMVRKYYWAAIIGLLFVIASASEVSAALSQNLHLEIF